MTPEFKDGAVVLIQQTTFALDGAIYAVEGNGQTCIKHVYKEKRPTVGFYKFRLAQSIRPL